MAVQRFFGLLHAGLAAQFEVERPDEPEAATLAETLFLLQAAALKAAEGGTDRERRLGFSGHALVEAITLGKAHPVWRLVDSVRRVGSPPASTAEQIKRAFVLVYVRALRAEEYRYPIRAALKIMRDVGADLTGETIKGWEQHASEQFEDMVQQLSSMLKVEAEKSQVTLAAYAQYRAQKEWGEDRFAIPRILKS